MDVVTKPGVEVFDETDEQLEPPYHLILLDDNEHTYHYVVLMLGAIFGYSAEKAFAIACVVDSQGQAILMTGSHDEVKAKQDLIHAFGPDPFMENCLGSMSAIIEPVE